MWVHRSLVFEPWPGKHPENVTFSSFSTCNEYQITEYKKIVLLVAGFKNCLVLLIIKRSIHVFWHMCLEILKQQRSKDKKSFEEAYSCDMAFEFTYYGGSYFNLPNLFNL